MKQTHRALIVAVLIAVVGLRAIPSPAKELTDDERMAWWREARFGMFIHWGLYAVPAGEWKGKPVRGIGEWIMNRGKIPLAEYRGLVKQFNPVKYDAAEWVRIAKDAGMKYIVITSKHHDGFCLWDSKYTEYDVASTPYGKDLLKPLAEECRKQGLKMCFYHSIMDWQHPNYEPLPGWDKNRQGHEGGYDKYVTYMKSQLAELVKDYGPLGVMWFDGEWERTWTHEHGVDLYNYVLGLQPDILINNRVDKGRRGMEGMSKGSEFKGDFGTPEQQIPAKGIPGVDWESCMTMNHTWGYKKDDHGWKSSQDLIRKLIDIASKGGNFLLNVGPTGQGLIPAPSVERLAAMGGWMKVNGEAIYGTTASPFGKVPFGRVTAKPGKLYLHVFDWPADGVIELAGMGSPVEKAFLLADGKAVTVQSADEDVLKLRGPKSVPESDATVIVVEYKGELKTVKYVPTARQAEDGSFTLTPALAEILGHGPLKYEADKKCLGFWTSKGNSVQWNLDVKKAGSYSVVLTTACPGRSAGTPCVLTCGESKLQFEVKATGDWTAFTDETLGKVDLAAGACLLKIVPQKKPKEGVMNLRQIRLVPAG